MGLYAASTGKVTYFLKKVLCNLEMHKEKGSNDPKDERRETSGDKFWRREN